MRYLVFLFFFLNPIWSCDVCSGVLSSTNYGMGLNNQIQNRIYAQFVSGLNHYGDQNQYLLGKYPILKERRLQTDIGVQWGLNKKFQIKAALPLKYYSVDIAQESGVGNSSYKSLGDVNLSITYALINKVDSIKDRMFVLNTSLLIQLPTGKSQLRDEVNQWKYHPLAQPGLGAYTIGCELDWSIKLKKQAINLVGSYVYGFENENQYHIKGLVNLRMGYMYAVNLAKDLKWIPGAYLGTSYNGPAQFKGVQDPLSEQLRSYAQIQNILQFKDSWNVNVGYQYQYYQSNTQISNMKSRNLFIQFWYSF